MRYELVAVGASWGGLQAVSVLLEGLPPYANVAVVIAQHRHKDSDDGLAQLLQKHTSLGVRDAGDKDVVDAGNVYLAPPDYHLLVERDGTLALSTDDPVHFARPSIDVLFESAAAAYGDRCIGIVLTGANEDGASGLKRIKDLGGVAIVQDPRSAERAEMPAAAIAATNADVVLPLEEIGKFLHGLLDEARERSRV
jgi:two-component system chemotaxis response regulator CheB